MRTLIFLTLVNAAIAQQIPACLDQLAPPVYSPLAKSAAVQGDVVLKFAVDADGRVGQVEVEGHAQLVAGAKQAVKSLWFERKQCRSRQFSIRYQFGFRNASEPYLPTSVTFVPPSGFKVLASLLPIQMQTMTSVCLQPLHKLVYPTLARYANVQGLAGMILHLNTAGGMERAEFEGHKLLTQDTERQLSGVRFDVSVCGRTIAVSMQFELKDPATGESTNSVAFEEPGILRISNHYAVANIHE